jgi:protein TonB
MFDTIVNRSAGHPGTRWTTAVVSASAHIVALMAIVLSTLYATDALPDPRSMTVFVAAAPLPPPPPPPAVVADVPKPVAQRMTRPQPAQARPAPRLLEHVAAPAPVEAPAGIAAETGLEGGRSPVASIEAGFEHGIAGGVAGGIVDGFETSLPAPPPAPAAPIRIGGALAAPALIHRVEPEYPLMAQMALIEGVVILEATVNREGRVEDLRVLRSHRVLEDAAVAAVKQWRYEPLLLNGSPSPFVLTVTVSFGLGR